MRALLVTLALVLSTVGCATAPRPAPAVETVGVLAPSYNSIAVAPVAPTTDLSRGSFVASDADDAPVTVGTGEAETPDLAPKGGIVVGEAR